MEGQNGREVGERKKGGREERKKERKMRDRERKRKEGRKKGATRTTRQQCQPLLSV